MRGVPKAFWSVHGAPQPLLSWLWTAWAGERAQLGWSNTRLDGQTRHRQSL